MLSGVSKSASRDGMDAELEEHRRLSRTLKRYVEPCFNEHRQSPYRRSQMGAAETVRPRQLGERSSL